jgi:hypothetical protein
MHGFGVWERFLVEVSIVYPNPVNTHHYVSFTDLRIALLLYYIIRYTYPNASLFYHDDDEYLP